MPKIHSTWHGFYRKIAGFREWIWTKVKAYLTIADCDLHDELEVLAFYDAAVPPDGLLSANSAFLET